MTANSGERYTCAGCGDVGSEAFGAGMWVPPGEHRSRAIPYLLCRVCAAAMRNDPERMIEVIEDRLLQAEGHA